jgi:hypothetical protein
MKTITDINSVFILQFEDSMDIRRTSISLCKTVNYIKNMNSVVHIFTINVVNY